MLLGEVLIDWGKGLAVSTPRSVELKKNELSTVLDKSIEVLSDNNLNWLVVLLWDLLRLVDLLKGSTLPLSDESLNSLSGELSLELELAEVSVSWVDDPKGWGVGSSDSDVVSKSLSKSRGNLGGEENDSVFVGLSNSLEDSVEVARSIIEVNDGWLLSSEDSLNSLISLEVHDWWESDGSDMGEDSVLGDSSAEGGGSIVVLGVDDNGVSSIGGLESGVGSVGEDDSIERDGSRLEGIEVSSLGSEEDGEDLVGLLLLLEVGGIIDGLGGWSGLLLDPVDDLWMGSSSVVFDWGSIDEEFESWVSLDLEFLGDVGVFGGVDLGERDWVVETLELLGGLGVLRGELLAVSTPWGVELDEHEFEFTDSLLEVAVSEDKDVLLFWETVVNSESARGDEGQKQDVSEVHLFL